MSTTRQMKPIEASEIGLPSTGRSTLQRIAHHVEASFAPRPLCEAYTRDVELPARALGLLHRDLPLPERQDRQRQQGDRDTDSRRERSAPTLSLLGEPDRLQIAQGAAAEIGGETDHLVLERPHRFPRVALPPTHAPKVVDDAGVQVGV